MHQNDKTGRHTEETPRKKHNSSYSETFSSDLTPWNSYHVQLTDEGLVTGAVDAVDVLTGVDFLTADASERVRAAATLQIASVVQHNQVQMY